MSIIKGNARIIPADRDAIFLPFQAKWIKDQSRLKLMEKARQMGISWSTAYGTDERAAAQGARFDEWVSSRDDIQARLFIEDCKLWAGIMGMAANDLGEVVLDQEKKLSAYVLQFASGRRIHTMSNARCGPLPTLASPGAATWSSSARIAARTAFSTTWCERLALAVTPRRSVCTGSPCRMR